MVTASHLHLSPFSCCLAFQIFFLRLTKTKYIEYAECFNGNTSVFFFYYSLLRRYKIPMQSFRWGKLNVIWFYQFILKIGYRINRVQKSNCIWAVHVVTGLRRAWMTSASCTSVGDLLNFIKVISIKLFNFLIWKKIIEWLQSRRFFSWRQFWSSQQSANVESIKTTNQRMN